MIDLCACQKTLLYTPPSHGDWGIVRIASMVPESHMLFVCPFACGRHGALGAIAQGYKRKVSYLYIEKKDIIDGYDGLIATAVREMLGRLKPVPKAIFVFVSCLDDLIGTDLEALTEDLHKTYPNVQFRPAHMNPITLDSESPPPVTMQDAMYSLLEPAALKTRSVNLIGNLVPLDANCEVYDVLKSMGMESVRHMSDYARFADFQQMARSSHNLVLSPAGLLAAKNMRKKHGTPFSLLPVSYDLAQVREQYRTIARFLDAPSEYELPAYDFSADICRAEQAIESALAVMGERPVVISSGAVIKPFSLAATLLDYGFHVGAVVAQEVIPLDMEGYERVRTIEKEKGAVVKIIQPQHPDVIRFEHRMEDALAVGFDAAYVTGSRHVVGLSGDQTMFGYRGIAKLMGEMERALESKADLELMIRQYGVVV